MTDGFSDADSTDEVQWLLARGADPEALTPQGQRPRDVARAGGGTASPSAHASKRCDTHATRSASASLGT